MPFNRSTSGCSEQFTQSYILYKWQSQNSYPRSLSSEPILHTVLSLNYVFGGSYLPWLSFSFLIWKHGYDNSPSIQGYWDIPWGEEFGVASAQGRMSGSSYHVTLCKGQETQIPAGWLLLEPWAASRALWSSALRSLQGRVARGGPRPTKPPTVRRRSSSGAVLGR